MSLLLLSLFSLNEVKIGRSFVLNSKTEDISSWTKENYDAIYKASGFTILSRNQEEVKLGFETYTFYVREYSIGNTYYSTMTHTVHPIKKYKYSTAIKGNRVSLRVEVDVDDVDEITMGQIVNEKLEAIENIFKLQFSS